MCILVQGAGGLLRGGGPGEPGGGGPAGGASTGCTGVLRGASLVVVDEVGKMESFSARFQVASLVPPALTGQGQAGVVTVPLVRKGSVLALARELVEREDTEVVEVGRWPCAPWPGDQGEQGGAAAGPAGQAPQLQLALHLRLFQALTF